MTGTEINEKTGTIRCRSDLFGIVFLNIQLIDLVIRIYSSICHYLTSTDAVAGKIQETFRV